MEKLNILWTTTNKDTIINMISMYSVNSINQGWWDEINIIVWGGSAKLIGEDKEIQAEVRKMIDAGVMIQGCLSCSDKYGVTETLKSLGIIMIYMGGPLTAVLRNNEKILTL